ncbi:hypothetical protein Dd703_2923 [Musicola paradisiaca Ech703]|uniref:Uncharacterized protein n=1 Tax=Musicola paradisiaca (strain Ech703) TaxID=579405 RepID=C6CBT8_MUSP7|nr:hypothetical protein Dd703_2923 [Musicola paradisiaca Ech703]
MLLPHDVVPLDVPCRVGVSRSILFPLPFAARLAELTPNNGKLCCILLESWREVAFLGQPEPEASLMAIFACMILLLVRQVVPAAWVVAVRLGNKEGYVVT